MPALATDQLSWTATFVGFPINTANGEGSAARQSGAADTGRQAPGGGAPGSGIHLAAKAPGGPPGQLSDEDLDPHFGVVNTRFGRLRYYAAFRPDPADILYDITSTYETAVEAYDKLKKSDKTIEATKQAEQHYDKLNDTDKFIDSVKRNSDRQLQAEANTARAAGLMSDSLRTSMQALYRDLPIARQHVEIASTTMHIDKLREEAEELAREARELAEGISKFLHTVGNIIKVATSPEEPGSWVDLVTGLFDDFIKPALAYSAKAERLSKQAMELEKGNRLAAVDVAVASVRALVASIRAMQPEIKEAAHHREVNLNIVARHFDEDRGGSGGFSMRKLNTEVRDALDLHRTAAAAVTSAQQVVTLLNKLQKSHPDGLWSPESGASKEAMRKLAAGCNAIYQFAEPIAGWSETAGDWLQEFQKMVVTVLADGRDG